MKTIYTTLKTKLKVQFLSCFSPISRVSVRVAILRFCLASLCLQKEKKLNIQIFYNQVFQILRQINYLLFAVHAIISKAFSKGVGVDLQLGDLKTKSHFYSVFFIKQIFLQLFAKVLTVHLKRQFLKNFTGILNVLPTQVLTFLQSNTFQIN